MAIFIGVFIIGGLTESYATYYDHEVSFQYPSGWNVTKEDNGVSLVYNLHSVDDIGIEKMRIVIYERTNQDLSEVTGDTNPTNKYSDGDKVITVYHFEAISTDDIDTTLYLVQTGGRIFLCLGFN